MLVKNRRLRWKNYVNKIYYVPSRTKYPRDIKKRFGVRNDSSTTLISKIFLTRHVGQFSYDDGNGATETCRR